MLVRLLALSAIIPLSVAIAGCACPHGGCGVPCTPTLPCDNELTVAEDELPELIELASAESLSPLPSPEETYHALDALTCQCRAATNLTAANLVELERYWAKVVISCDTKAVRENLCLDRDLLALRATGLRNEAAGASLKAFYQLAGIEVQKHYLQMGIDESRRSLGRIDQLDEKGIELPEKVDRGAILSQIAELEDKKLQLDFLRIQLNGQLQKMTGCPLDEWSFFWPQVDWQPDLSPVDVECELAEGLSTRSDIRGLGLVICQLEKNTLPVARGVLKFAETTVGTVEPQDGAIHWVRCRTCNDTELPLRCRQLALFYTDTEQGATAEIKGAAYQIGLQQQRVVAAQALVDRLEARKRELEETRDINDVTVFEISNARAQIFEAESKLIEQVVQLKIADAALREAQGMLAVECGFCPQLCCEGCCDGACVRCKQCCGKGCSKCSTCKPKQPCCE
ncbi:MAG: TolC family protein [Planctomycetota bacterium]